MITRRVNSLLEPCISYLFLVDTIMDPPSYSNNVSQFRIFNYGLELNDTEARGLQPPSTPFSEPRAIPPPYSPFISFNSTPGPTLVNSSSVQTPRRAPAGSDSGTSSSSSFLATPVSSQSSSLAKPTYNFTDSYDNFFSRSTTENLASLRPRVSGV